MNTKIKPFEQNVIFYVTRVDGADYGQESEGVSIHDLDIDPDDSYNSLDAAMDDAAERVHNEGGEYVIIRSVMEISHKVYSGDVMIEGIN